MKHLPVYLIGCILILSGCEKFLDEKYDTKLLVPESIQDLQSLLDKSNHMNETYPSLMQMASDDYFVQDEILDGLSDFIPIYTWGDYQSRYQNPWSICYNAVYVSNLCLERINSVSKTSENQDAWNNVKGTALFFRGEKYLSLLWTYAKAYDAQTADKDWGIVLRNGSDFNIPSRRSTMDESYVQVVNDLRNSIAYLPARPFIPSRPSKLAAYGMLGRAFLSMRLYDSAFHYVNKALEIYDDLQDFNDPILHNRAVPFEPYPYNKEVIFFLNGDPPSLVSTSIAKIDTLLYDSYTESDLRLKLFFRPIEDYQQFIGNFNGTNGRLFCGLTTSELWLIKAECLARLNKIQEAMDILNGFLVNRHRTDEFVPFEADGQMEALNIILQERRKELVMRGLRWMDIKRLNKEGANIIPKRSVHGEEFTIEPNAARYAFLLPVDIIQITGMPQNE